MWFQLKIHQYSLRWSPLWLYRLQLVWNLNSYEFIRRHRFSDFPDPFSRFILFVVLFLLLLLFLPSVSSAKKSYIKEPRCDFRLSFLGGNLGGILELNAIDLVSSTPGEPQRSDGHVSGQTHLQRRVAQHVKESLCCVRTGEEGTEERRDKAINESEWPCHLRDFLRRSRQHEFVLGLPFGLLPRLLGCRAPNTWLCPRIIFCTSSSDTILPLGEALIPKEGSFLPNSFIAGNGVV